MNSHTKARRREEELRPDEAVASQVARPPARRKVEAKAHDPQEQARRNAQSQARKQQLEAGRRGENPTAAGQARNQAHNQQVVAQAQRRPSARIDKPPEMQKELYAKSHEMEEQENGQDEALMRRIADFFSKISNSDEHVFGDQDREEAAGLLQEILGGAELNPASQGDQEVNPEGEVTDPTTLEDQPEIGGYFEKDYIVPGDDVDAKAMTALINEQNKALEDLTKKLALIHNA